MAHYYEHEDANGDLVDLTIFCSDYCHLFYCMTQERKYKGWNGCHEQEETTNCAYCGALIEGYKNG
jgi:hypothetical protein